MNLPVLASLGVGLSIKTFPPVVPAAEAPPTFRVINFKCAFSHVLDEEKEKKKDLT